MRTDHLYPFSVEEKDVVVIQPRTDRRGVIELQAIEGASVYLFKGTLQKEEAEAAAANGFHLAAAIGQAAWCKLEDSIGPVTVFAKKDATGFVRIIEC